MCKFVVLALCIGILIGMVGCRYLVNFVAWIYNKIKNDWWFFT